jgi:hypothetical protein
MYTKSQSVSIDAFKFSKSSNYLLFCNYASALADRIFYSYTVYFVL